jgi:hypothetical protein
MTIFYSWLGGTCLPGSIAQGKAGGKSQILCNVLGVKREGGKLPPLGDGIEVGSGHWINGHGFFEWIDVEP